MSDHARLVAQALAISRMLDEDGIGPCTLSEGVRELLQRLEKAEAAAPPLVRLREHLTQALLHAVRRHRPGCEMTFGSQAYAEAAYWRVIAESLLRGREIARLSRKVHRLRVKLRRLGAEGEARRRVPRAWQPIETAPKDGSRFLGGWVHRSYGWLWDGARWSDDKNYPGGGYFCMESGGEPTYWLQLPAAPRVRSSALPAGEGR